MAETVGKIAVDLAQKADNKHTVVEQMQENLTDYERNVIECAERGLKQYNSDFYIVVLTKKEPLFENIIRNLFHHRKSCPTPQYDQVVYQYQYKQDALKFLWCIPDKETCEVYKTYKSVVQPEERQLLQFVLDFDRGMLDQLARRLNNEAGNTQFLEDKHVVPKAV